MSQLSTAVTRLNRSELPRARATLGRAFFDYPLMAYALADDEPRAKAVTALYGAILLDCFRYGEVQIAAAGAGLACWLPPGVGVPGLWRQIRAGLLSLPFRFGRGGFDKLLAYDQVARRLHHDYAPMPHWYLAALGVDPDRQGQGIGSALLRPMLARADSTGTACWLDTHRERNVKLYERHGFETCECLTPPGHPVPVWGMLRRPRS
jgi:ribosomal protein S18 acetylase RimI-like enzyme